MLKDPISDDDHIQGNKNAQITLIEYGDYECPYCGRAYPVIKRLQEHFGTQLRFVFRNFPLTEVHPFANPAAECAEYAGSQGLFWEMHDLIYENQLSLNIELLFELAGSRELQN
jgi:protein-disulfide isomerase